MSDEAGDRRRTELRRRTGSDDSLEDMMEAVVTDSLPVEPTVMMSLIDLLMLNAIVCGLEFCASAAFCYIPPLLLKAGIRYDCKTIFGVRFFPKAIVFPWCSRSHYYRATLCIARSLGS